MSNLTVSFTTLHLELLPRPRIKKQTSNKRKKWLFLQVPPSSELVPEPECHPSSVLPPTDKPLQIGSVTVRSGLIRVNKQKNVT